jgi:hypothetical protein
LVADGVGGGVVVLVTVADNVVDMLFDDVDDVECDRVAEAVGCWVGTVCVGVGDAASVTVRVIMWLVVKDGVRRVDVGDIEWDGVGLERLDEGVDNHVGEGVRGIVLVVLWVTDAEWVREVNQVGVGVATAVTVGVGSCVRVRVGLCVRFQVAETVRLRLMVPIVGVVVCVTLRVIDNEGEALGECVCTECVSECVPRLNETLWVSARVVDVE